MPFLRVVHDKRGYETTYLMELYREGHRQRSRILYVFRTPGGARGGRESLDPDVRERLEVQFPGIAFNWKEIRENQQHIDMTVEPRRRRPRAEPPSAPLVAPVPAEAEDVAPTDAALATGTEPPLARPPVVPSAIEGATPDEQMAFLAHWYPLILERIPRRTSDPTRRDALTALADRLNPATWTDADQIASGLQRASEALERLSHVFARRRRRRKRPAETSAPGVETPPTA